MREARAAVPISGEKGGRGQLVLCVCIYLAGFGGGCWRELTGCHDACACDHQFAVVATETAQEPEDDDGAG